MPQYPQQVVVNTGANRVATNLTSATLIATGPATINRVNVIVAGTGVGTINDAATTGAAAVSNQIGSTPTIAANIDMNMPVIAGLVVVPGTGQTLAVSWRKP